jgi:hypothetical protein
MGRPRLEDPANGVITFAVNKRDAERIKAAAAAAGLPVSTFVRSAALGRQIRSSSALDREAVRALAKVNADQGRLGGLLKVWLADRPDRGASQFEVRRLLNEIRELQGQLADVVERL